MSLPRSVEEYQRDWEPRLLNPDPKVREEAVRELLRLGITQLQGIRDAVKARLRLVHIFAEALHADTPLLGPLVEQQLGRVLRVNWDAVQRYLKNPALLRDELHKLKPDADTDILYTDEGWEWLQRELNNLYDWLRAVAWIVRCELCHAQVKPNQFLVEYEGEIDPNTKTFNIKQRRYWCTRPRCKATYLVRMANRLEGGEAEELRRQIEELKQRDPVLARELTRASKKLEKDLLTSTSTKG